MYENIYNIGNYYTAIGCYFFLWRIIPIFVGYKVQKSLRHESSNYRLRKDGPRN